MTNLTSVSSAPIARFGNKKYYDLVGTIEVMKRVLNESVVDGFELQLERARMAHLERRCCKVVKLEDQ